MGSPATKCPRGRSVAFRPPHAGWFHVDEDVCDFGKDFPDMRPDARSDSVPFGDSDPRIDFSVKIDVMLEPGLSRVALFDAPDAFDLESGSLYAFD